MLPHRHRTTRSAGNIASIEALGAARRGGGCVRRRSVAPCHDAAKPEVVIHQLTDLPDVSDPTQMTAVREKNSRLRIEGTESHGGGEGHRRPSRRGAKASLHLCAGAKPYRESDPLDSSEAQR